MVVVFGQKRQSREVPFFGFHCQLELHDSNNDTVPVLIRDPAACHTDELDDCANVKFLSRIELSIRRGRDTRPTTDEDHAKLHGG